MLILDSIIEPGNRDGMGDKEYFSLTRKTKENFLEGLDIELDPYSSDAKLLEHGSIHFKQMFYTPGVELKINNLNSLLSPEKFSEIQTRLDESGFRKGFACLFYGAPGTGKTETVYQLAKATGRDIMVVDIPQIKSCWVGESEKNIKHIFDSYKRLVKRLPNAPILLFNEADAIFGQRMEGAMKAADKMENTMQNIILQEMENLEGILVATTNLSGNMDSAFERRFIYKIQFDKPDANVRANIWKSMIPDMAPQYAEHLGKCYSFSGGQIENIARKRTVSTILNGTEPTLAQLEVFCKEESASLHNCSSRRIGF